MMFEDVDDCAWVGFVDVKCCAVPEVMLCRELAQRTREGVHVDDRVDCVSAVDEGTTLVECLSTYR